MCGLRPPLHLPVAAGQPPAHALGRAALPLPRVRHAFQEEVRGRGAPVDPPLLLRGPAGPQAWHPGGASGPCPWGPGPACALQALSGHLRGVRLNGPQAGAELDLGIQDTLSPEGGS